ncbi:uncharacterized protein LOC144772334 isoform X2 [Lissotriton helveticus]
MSHHQPRNALLTFQDVVAGFSQVEFELLQSWQSDLYANLMNEIHQVFLSLGPVISNFVFSLKEKEKEGLCFVNDDSDRGPSEDHCPSDIVATSVISQRFTTDNKSLFQQETEDEQGNAGDIVATSVISQSFTEDNQTLFKQESEDEQGNTGSHAEDGHTPGGSEERKEDVHASETGHMSDRESLTCSIKNLQGMHSTEGCFACTECAGIFHKKALLVAHQRIHQELRSYLCTKSERSFSENASLLKDHGLRTRVKPSHFKDSEKSENQNHETHSVGGPHHCTNCDKSFTRKLHLRYHQRIHTGERPYHCTDCEKSFALRQNLLEHQRIHTGEKPYQCKECEKSFTQKSHLRYHQRTHTGERPYRCTECEKSFIRMFDLKDHQRKHTGETAYHCSKCEKSFVTMSNLKRHQRTHTGERPYKCIECEKSFNLKQTLKVHQRMHTGERPCHNTECDQTFDSMSNLQHHRQTHTDVEPL